MKAKNLFILMFALCVSGSAFSQSVNYKVTKDDDSYQRIQAWLIPFYADAHLANIHMGWGFGGVIQNHLLRTDWFRAELKEKQKT
ncbi:MAG: hypothetical protein K9H64_04400 [Bacteroidales bacterium]|nr:hypothetical protein [Bacteroidales bacterium]MCF8454991.1 hypothetical protein [Bacteroidales bacterium]